MDVVPQALADQEVTRNSASVVVYHRVAGFCEEQPALDQYAECLDQYGERRNDHRQRSLPAEQDQQQRKKRGRGTTGQNGDREQLVRMLASHAETHFTGEIVVVAVWLLEQADLADMAESGCGLRVRQRRLIGRALTPQDLYRPRRNQEQDANRE